MKDFLKFVLAVVGVAFVGAIVLLTVSAVKQKPIKELLSKKKAVESVVDATTDDKGDEEQPVVEEKTKLIYTIEDSYQSTIAVGNPLADKQFNSYYLDTKLYEYVADAAVVPINTINANNEETEILLYRSQSSGHYGAGSGMIQILTDNSDLTQATTFMFVYPSTNSTLEARLYTTTELTFDFSTLVDEEEHYSVIDFAEDDFWSNLDEGCYSSDLSNEIITTLFKNQMVGLQVNLKDGTTRYGIMTCSNNGCMLLFTYYDGVSSYYNIRNDTCRFNIDYSTFNDSIDSISLYVQNK